jgi:cytidylate kinase
MSIIIISSDSDRIAHEMAQSVAETLDYDLVNRDILGDVANKYQIPEERFIQALDERPSLFRIPSKLWYRYLAYIQEATLAELVKDNAVCQGLAAHLYVLGVSHVLRIMILSDPEKHIQDLASQESISREKAQKLLNQEKKFSRRWSIEAFGLDETDPSQYDLVISLSKIDPDEAVKIIKETISYRRFRPMTYSIKCINDIELASRVRSALIAHFPDVRVRANRGTVVIETTALKREKQKRSNFIKEVTADIQGVEYVEVHVINDIFRQAIESFR